MGCRGVLLKWVAFLQKGVPTFANSNCAILSVWILSKSLAKFCSSLILLRPYASGGMGTNGPFPRFLKAIEKSLILTIGPIQILGNLLLVPSQFSKPPHAYAFADAFLRCSCSALCETKLWQETMVWLLLPRLYET